MGYEEWYLSVFSILESRLLEELGEGAYITSRSWHPNPLKINGPEKHSAQELAGYRNAYESGRQAEEVAQIAHSILRGQSADFIDALSSRVSADYFERVKAAEERLAELSDRAPNQRPTTAIFLWNNEIPVDYATAAIEAGVRVQEILKSHDSGMPIEYLQALYSG